MTRRGEFVETVHYDKTELEVITVNELDGEKTEDPQIRNILREKTFNSELNQLVNKIYNNEQMIEEPVPVPEMSDPAEKYNLLLEYEKIIYRLKHSDELNSVSSRFNPFETDINVYDDIDDTADYIKAGMLQSGYSRYQILKYNFNDKAYRSDINHLDSSYSSDMYFSNNDPLILKINDYIEGFVLTPDIIKSDPFFSKKFLNSDADDLSQHKFYIVKISSLFKNTCNGKMFANKFSRFEESLSPLLLIELDSEHQVNPEKIFRNLEETAALPLIIYFLKNIVKFSINNLSYENILFMIELFIKSAVNTRLKSYIVTLVDYSRKDNIFIYKYFLSKLRRILNRNYLILKISINRAVVITTAPDMRDIDHLIERINSGVKIIGMESVDYNEYLNSKEFVNLFL